MKKQVLLLLFLAVIAFKSFSESYPLKKILIIVEGNYDLNSKATAHGRELAQLMGHFNTVVTFEDTNHYSSKECENFDYTFYIGTSGFNHPPAIFCRDLMKTEKPIIWINGGYSEFCRMEGVAGKFGFSTSDYSWVSEFNVVRANGVDFKKGTGEINRIQIQDKKKVEIWATVFSIKTKAELPYMVKSGNLIYVADLPFLGAEAGDRYLFFADKLHDILNELHAESHRAMIRIEDVTPLRDPDQLREIADILSERGIPFLVGVVPIYFNPKENRRVYLSDRPEMVDALKYMVHNGGTIVMHGTTHQYKGESTDDCEFWDGEAMKPIPNEDPEEFAAKIKLGIDELTKNGLHPVVWETPHYEASVAFYQVIPRFFSSVVEQRMVINDVDYGQYFPYIINKDIYGQKIYPENLGYVPLSKNIEDSKTAVRNMIKAAEGIKQVRDGIACGFFHPFLDLDLLKTLVDGIADKGFTFWDIKDSTHWVKTSDKVILTGIQSYSLGINNDYLHESYFNADNKLFKKSYSPDRIQGDINKSILLAPGETYFAEAVDYHVKELSFKDRIMNKINSSYRSLAGNNGWQPFRVKVLWNPAAMGAAYFDQCSFISVFSHLNIPVDTLFNDAGFDLSDCNLLIVPYSCTNRLPEASINEIKRFVDEGGNLITDNKNNLIQAFGFTFADTQVKLHNIRDKYYPDEIISWKTPQLASELDYEADDEILCTEPSNSLPVVIGRRYGSGKIIYLNTLFDPLSKDGYSYYPYLMDHIRRYFYLQPVVKCENLEMYFDPGYRHNTSEEELVKSWVKLGIRIIHVAAWQQWLSYTYDYARLIKLAHDNGILVYAWIEPPQVSKKFWDEHPEWREKNYLNQDIHKDEELAPSWRYPVALTDNNCFAAARKEYLNLLTKYDFDGVNIAEMNFEAGNGLDEPELFTPMHPSALKEFHARYGFDLRDIFKTGSLHYWKSNPSAREKVKDYRIGKVTELHDTLLTDITRFAGKRPGFDVVVTFYDSYFSPEITENHGVSSDQMIGLQKKYHFKLQPEDPADKWSTDPDRYIEMGRMYAGKMTDSTRLMLDLNILNFRRKEDITPFPTLIQTGTESFYLVNAASKGAPQFTIYSESSCNSQDLWFFPYASSAKVKYKYIENGLQVSSPCSFVLHLPENTKTISVDGTDLAGYRDNNFVIPAGEHNIKTHLNELPGFSTDELQPEMLSFSGNLLKVSYEMDKMTFHYKSDGRAIASLNYKPTSVLVDDVHYSFNVLKGNDCFSVMLPAGDHRVEITIGDTFSKDINLASLLSMEAIVLYGFLAVALLFILYFILKLVRKRYEK
jgi:uncharacterized protein YdaL